MRAARTISGAGVAGLLGVVLAACSAPAPMTMPPADGRAETVTLNGRSYVVGRQELAQAAGRMSVRVTREGGADLDYSDGLVAKRVAEAYCGQYHRALHPDAYGMFSAPASWIFEGGCA